MLWSRVKILKNSDEMIRNSGTSGEMNRDFIFDRSSFVRGTGDDAAIAACGGSMQVFLQRIEPEE